MRGHSRERTQPKACGAALGLGALLVMLAVLPGDSMAQSASTGGEPFSIEATLVGGPQLNPNLEGRPSPVVVRIFELNSTTAFLAADYAGLFEHAQQTLGADALAQEEIVLRPGEIRHYERAGAPQPKALGLAAAFRSIEQGRWRLVVPLTPQRHNLLLIDFDTNRIRMPMSERSGGRD